MKRAVASWLLAFGIGCAVLSGSTAAEAQEMAAAANAFSRAQKAELAGDFEGAAELYELADSLAPAPEALRSALKARKAAGQLGSAAIHAEALLKRYPDDKKSTELGNATLEEAKHKLVRYEIRCVPRACNVLVDGAASSTEDKTEQVLYLEPGDHQVSASFGNQQTDAKATQAVLGEEQTLTFDAPPPEPKRALTPGASDGIDTSTPGALGDTGTSRGGLSPWFFVAGTVVTVGVGAAAVWSGLDVLDAHDQYDGKETRRAYEDGKDKEKRTNLLIGGTAVAGTVTIVIAAFTNWKGKGHTASGSAAARVRPEAVVLPNGGAVGVRGSF